MKNKALRSFATICCVCIFSVLMCAFFIDESHAAQIATGTTTKKEQTVQMKLFQGTSVITVQDVDSWVFAQLQTTGNNKLGTALNGENLLTNLGQKKSFVVQIKTTGTYYLYLHGTNAGATYTVQQYKQDGTLKNGVPKTGTSYGDNQSISYYRISIPGTGKLSVTVNDASLRYPGYSKVRLKKGDAVISGEEHLIKGMDYTTVYGVSQGTYYIGVRSSSELYKITAKFKSVNPARYSSTKSKAPALKRGVGHAGVITPGDRSARWYKVQIPASSGKKTITLQTKNNNLDLYGGTAFTFSYKNKSGGKLKKASDKYILNNDKQTYQFSSWPDKTRTIYVKVAASGNCCGTYSITWN